MARTCHFALLLIISCSSASAMAGCHYYASVQRLSDASTDCTLEGTLRGTSSSSRALNSLGRYGYARDDAAAFVASNGEIRGAFLEQALREQRALRAIGDHEIAFAVIAQTDQ